MVALLQKLPLGVCTACCCSYAQDADAAQLLITNHIMCGMQLGENDAACAQFDCSNNSTAR